MQITGKLFEVFESKQVTEKFKKREFVVEYAENTQYPEYIKFQLNQDKCELIDGFKINDPIEVHFNLTGKPWTNKDGLKTYFTNLVAWKLNKAGNVNSQSSEEEPHMESSSDDDLPF
ncbi:MAG: DUF3127 domain-containing protein [Bacteroidetes bacterium]|nr:DUF3127 domain-containing protein [Bacteroidota bacterium]